MKAIKNFPVGTSKTMRLVSKCFPIFLEVELGDSIANIFSNVPGHFPANYGEDCVHSQALTYPAADRIMRERTGAWYSEISPLNFKGVRTHTYFNGTRVVGLIVEISSPQPEAI